jgi:hypothetical protein
VPRGRAGLKLQTRGDLDRPDVRARLNSAAHLLVAQGRVAMLDLRHVQAGRTRPGRGCANVFRARSSAPLIPSSSVLGDDPTTSLTEWSDGISAPRLREASASRRATPATERDEIPISACVKGREALGPVGAAPSDCSLRKPARLSAAPTRPGRPRARVAESSTSRNPTQPGTTQTRQTTRPPRVRVAIARTLARVARSGGLWDLQPDHAVA